MTLGYYYKTNDIRSRVIDGLAVVLDLRAGNYVILDEVATAMWRSLLTAPPPDRVEILSRRFDASPERLNADLEAFARQCVERGILATEQPPRLASERRAAPRLYPRPTAWRAWRALLASARSLRSEGFPRTYARYAGFEKPATDGDAAEELLCDAERAFAKAENFFVMPTAPKDCLPRSLALYRFMLSVGVPVEHCIGVNRFPFAAHAWVEYRGRIIRDSESFVRYYAKLAEL